MLITALLVNSANIRCRNNTSSSKKRVIENVSHLLAANTTAVSADDIFQTLLERERLGSTGLGKGVAIPHARIPNLSQTIAAMMTLAMPVNYDAPDNRSVDIVFGLLVPENDNDVHLQNLARLVTLFRDEQMCQSIRNATDPEEMYNLMLAMDVD